MSDKPEIIKELMEEEKLGRLEGRLQSVYEGLKITEESSDDVQDEIIDVIENSGKIGENTSNNKKYGKSMRELLKIIQLTEKASTEIYVVTDEVEIYRLVMEEFNKSKEYFANIFLLTDDETEFSIITSPGRN
ncbi:MAG: hypothetical protein KAW47_09920 [Thermoplasmatales archaeon]|nr:hypothetical protein [Thermoplasmatales archaeon]